MYDQACDPAELDGATALWFTILLMQFPFASNYYFGPVKTSIAGNAGHIDPGVYRLFVLHDQAIRPLLFIEWRRAAPDTPYGRRNAETKILATCNEFLTAHPERPHIYAMVCAGGRAKIWRVEQESRSLTPLSPAWSADDEEPYADAKFDDKDLLKQAFEEIRQSRPVRHHLGSLLSRA